MNGRRLTDAQISTALRAHLPEAAAAGLRERVFEATQTTSQLRALPSFLGALSDADPIARRRTLLIAAALLVALALASAAAVGALRVFEKDPVDRLSLDPPADLPAFVLSSYERLPQLPPVALTWRDSDSGKGRIYVDESGAVRFDDFASSDATEPSSYRILSPDHRISGMARVDAQAVWIEPGHEAIGDDPRVFLGTVLSGGDWPGCELERDPSAEGSGSPATGWRYVGLEYVAGRPTHHVACVGDLWIDIETRLTLRTREPMTDDAGQPVPGQFDTTEVTEIAFGGQPAALFEPPPGIARISADEYNAFICTRDLPNEIAPGISDCPSTEEAEATSSPEPSPTPTPTGRADTSDCAVPPGDPSKPIGPLAWTPESLKEDWPAPVRPEPASGRGVEPMALTYLDPMGDNGSDAYSCVDIRWVTATADAQDVQLKLVSSQPQVVEPAERWIAYGIVTDDDRDGVPDRRYGIDNIPADTAEKGPSNRGWRTNLHTGETEAGPEHGDPVWTNGGGFKSGYPMIEPNASFRFGDVVETTTGPAGWGFELDMPFYTWASVIVDGRVVATDFAPDSGWLLATPGATPAGTFLLGDPYPSLAMAVPEGWTWGSDSSIFSADPDVLRRVKCGDLPRDYPPDQGYDADCATVRFVVIDTWEDMGVCGSSTPPLGSTFDEFVTFVEGSPTIVAEDVMIDGHRGMHLTGDDWCLGDDVWLLDVDGVRLMIDSDPNGDLLHGDVSEEAVKAQIRHMVESIHLER